MKKAEDIINKSKYSKKTKNKMMWLLDKTAKYSNLNRALDEMEDESDNKTIKDIMKKFNKCNLSPITIPRRWNKEHLPNPLTYAKEWMNEVFSTSIADL